MCFLHVFEIEKRSFFQRMSVLYLGIFTVKGVICWYSQSAFLKKRGIFVRANISEWVNFFSIWRTIIHPPFHMLVGGPGQEVEIPDP